jgi:hypothetical protein
VFINRLRALGVSSLTQSNQSEKTWCQYTDTDENKQVTPSITNNGNVYSLNSSHNDTEDDFHYDLNVKRNCIPKVDT